MMIKCEQCGLLAPAKWVTFARARCLNCGYVNVEPVGYPDIIKREKGLFDGLDVAEGEEAE